jgi:L-alanine-DL-glutamate epimerase-like enolase superfamily enzyme
VNSPATAELLDAVTGAAGSGVEILVDAGRSWDVPTAAERSAELFERFELGWIEDPLHNPHPSGYAALDLPPRNWSRNQEYCKVAS